MSNQEHPSTTSPHLPVHVFANVGEQDNLISIKRFVTAREARTWAEQMKIERPGFYCITDTVEMDPFG